MGTEANRLVDSVEEARMALLDGVATLGSSQSAFKPSPAEWSIEEILEHLYLAELGGITKIWAALQDARSGRCWTGPLSNRGKPIEEIIALTWNAKETAPPVATPHFGGPLVAWVAALRSLRVPLRELAGELTDAELGQVVFPHFLSGPLDARQRLEFLRFHIERHLGQIQSIRQRPGFPWGARPV